MKTSAPLIALNIEKVEHAIAASIASQRHLQATVTCPAEVLQKAGVTFTCHAVVSRQTQAIPVPRHPDRQPRARPLRRPVSAGRRGAIRLALLLIAGSAAAACASVPVTTTGRPPRGHRRRLQTQRAPGASAPTPTRAGDRATPAPPRRPRRPHPEHRGRGARAPADRVGPDPLRAAAQGTDGGLRAPPLRQLHEADLAAAQPQSDRDPLHRDAELPGHLQHLRPRHPRPRAARAARTRARTS